MTQPPSNEQSTVSAEAPASPEGYPADRNTLANMKSTPVAPSGLRGFLVNITVPLLLVVAAVGIGAVLINSPPDVPKSDAEVLAPVVGLAELMPHDAKVHLNAFGNVIPSREIQIIPEVGGRVIELNDKLKPGGLLSADETLLKIEPIDYEIDIAQWEAELEVAQHEAARLYTGIDTLRGRGQQLDVEIEYLQWNSDRLSRLAESNAAAESEARDARTQLESQKAARRTIDAEIAQQEKAVETARARVRVAERRLEAARLSLERTVVKVPFDAIVVSENIEKGQLIGSQASIATLAAIDEFWAEAAIPVARLKDIRFQEDGADEPSEVTIRLAAGSGTEIERKGVALRPLGDLDPLGRMAQVVVSIRDPLGIAEGSEGDSARRILLGSYVRLQIASGTLQDVYTIPRKALRENDRIWVRDAEGKLAIRPVEIVWRRHEDVLVRNGFHEGDQLVTSHLASVVPGMPLRVRDESSEDNIPEAAIANDNSQESKSSNAAASLGSNATTTP